MNISEFENLLDQYGWDIASWPEPFRQEGNRFVAQNGEAAELIRHLHSLEDDFAADPVPMGRHKAIDDIFGAIEAAENDSSIPDEREISSRSTGKQTPFDTGDNGVDADYRAPLSDDMVSEKPRRYVPVGSPRNAGERNNTQMTAGTVGQTGHDRTNQGAINVSAAQPVRTAIPRSYMISAAAMVLCMVFGFVFGVTFTARQGFSNTAEADELPVARIVDRHLYDLAMPDNDTTGDQTGQDAVEEKPNDK